MEQISPNPSLLKRGNKKNTFTASVPQRGKDKTITNYFFTAGSKNTAVFDKRSCQPRRSLSIKIHKNPKPKKPKAMLAVAKRTKA